MPTLQGSLKARTTPIKLEGMACSPSLSQVYCPSYLRRRSHDRAQGPQPHTNAAGKASTLSTRHRVMPQNHLTAKFGYD